MTRSVEHARSFLTRFKGLLFRAGIPADHALVLWKTKSIHMFGMLFSIDVIFLDEGKKVLALFPDRCPFSFPVGSWSARFAVECAAGTIARTGVQVGHILAWPD